MLMNFAPPPLQSRLAADARWETYNHGEVIMEQGSTHREIIVVTRGQAAAPSPFAADIR